MPIGPNCRTVLLHIFVLCLTDIPWLLQFYSHLISKLEVVNMKTDFLNRNVNEGFSGGERKRNEILQLAVLLSFPLFLSSNKHHMIRNKRDNRRQWITILV